MDEEIIEEQPNSADNVHVTEVNKEEGIALEAAIGSSYGKFKDAESLFSAYNNLQAEFTKKCQKLSELEKSEVQDVEQNQPIFLSENWNEKVSGFLETNSEAGEYANEISDIILKNEEIAKSPNALELAWAKVVQNNYIAPKKLSSDENVFNNYIFSNEDLKNKVLSLYLKELENTKTPPTISSHTGGAIAFAAPQKANTLSEAKSLVEKIFNVKGD